MSVKFFMTGWLVWVILVFVNSLFQQSMTGVDDLNIVLSVGIVEWKEVLRVPIPVPNVGWFSSLFNLLTWDFWFLAGNLIFVRIIGFLWIMAGFVWGFWTSFLPVILRLVEATASVLRSLNPFSG